MIELIQGDCLIESDKISDGSVDLILTDLPYGTVKDIKNVNHGMSGKCEWDVVIDTNAVHKIANRILRKNGKMVLFSQEPYTSKMITLANPNVPFSYRMVWLKDHFANSLIAKKSPLNYYEDVLVFSKTYDFEGLHPLRPYFKDVFSYIGQSKKTIIEKVGQRVDHTFRFNSSQFSLCTKETYEDLIYHFGIDKMEGFKTHNDLSNESDNMISTFNLWEGNKFKSNILKYKKDYSGHHPTQKPVALLEDLIKTFSNENNLIVDLTMGSGSTMIACQNTNRNGIGIELDAKYFEIAKNRVEENKNKEVITKNNNQFFNF